MNRLCLRLCLGVGVLCGGFGCVTETGTTPEPAAVAKSQENHLPAPEFSEVEAAYKQDRLAWIASRFAGPEQKILYTDQYGDNHWVWQYVGYAFLRNSDYARAATAFRMVLKQEPKFSPAMYNLACVAALAGETDKALELLQLLATRVRPFEALRRKYFDLIQTDKDLALVRQDQGYARTLDLFR